MGKEAQIELIVSALSGGAAGTLITILYNVLKEKIKATAREKGIITALAGEVNRNRLLCIHNASLQHLSIAPFVHFPVSVASLVTFEERNGFPKLKSLNKNLEWYTLALYHMNEQIDTYRILLVPTGRPPSETGDERDSLRNHIVSICSGNVIKGIGPNDEIVLTKLIDEIWLQIRVYLESPERKIIFWRKNSK